MARDLFAAGQIPEGKADIPYADHTAIARSLMQHACEAVMVQGEGAGGAGVDIDIPLNPAFMYISEDTGPLLQAQFQVGGAVVGVNAITGAAAAADVGVTDNGDGTYTLNVPTGVAPDGDTVTILVLGFRDVNGSL